MDVNERSNDASEDFVFSRTFDAPRDLMFRVWTESEHLQHWFGPKGAEIFSCSNDFRPGGVFHYGMRTPEGIEIWGKWTYREIVKPERLVFVTSFSDPQQNVTRHPFAADWPLETLSIITFAEEGGKTTVTVRWSPINATAAEQKTFTDGRPSMQQGWGGTFERLADYLAKVA